MKKSVYLLSFLLCCFTLSACGAVTDTPDSVPSQSATNPSIQESTSQELENNNSSSAFTASSQATEPVTDTNSERPRQLTEEELQHFTDFISTEDNRGNYGFLLSVYDSPDEIDLNEVFYSGAGLDTYTLTKEEEAAYLKVSGESEIYTNVIRLTARQIEEFLLKKTGLTYQQVKKPLSWVYLPEYDAYYSQVGDTNYAFFTCVGGTTVDEKQFTLRFQKEDISSSAYHTTDYELVLEKSDDGYLFLSNHLLLEDGQITDQTFQVTLEPLGEVTFASYEPSTQIDPLADVTFKIIKDGQEYLTLFGMYDNNIRANDIFNFVEAVSFPDYNNDGYTDIIIICNYSPASGAETAFSEARIYYGNSYGIPGLDKELSETTNSALAKLTIESVMGFLGAK